MFTLEMRVVSEADAWAASGERVSIEIKRGGGFEKPSSVPFREDCWSGTGFGFSSRVGNEGCC